MASRFLEFPVSLVNDTDRKSRLTLLSRNVRNLLESEEKLGTVGQKFIAVRAMCD